MRSSSCQIEFAYNKAATVHCGKPAIAKCADCGTSICSDCRTECCEQSFCDYCYEYHAAHSCLRKPAAHTEGQRRLSGKDAA